MSGEPAIRLGEDRAATAVYGLAHFGKSLYWHTGEILLAYYLTELCGLSPRATGVVLAAGLTSSAAIDLLVGQALIARLASVERACRVQFAGALASGAALLLVFGTVWVSAPWRLAYALAADIVFRFVFALYDLPQNALLSLATGEQRSRTVVAATRIAASGAAFVLVAAAIWPLLGAGAPDQRARRFVGLALVLAAVAAATAWALRVVLGQGGAALARPARARRVPWRALLAPEIVQALALMFAVNASLPAFAKLAPYYASFVLHSPGAGASTVMALAAAASLSQPLWAAQAQRLRWQGLVALSAVLTIVCSAAFLAARGPWSALACAIGLGAAGGGSAMALWAGFADAVRHSARGHEGPAWGLFTASSKLALAAAGLAIGTLLNDGRYRGAEPGLIPALMAGLPIAGGLACLMIVAARRRRPAFDAHVR